MSARAFSSATVSFGLVSIPVKLYSTTESSSSLQFNMINRQTGSRVKQQYVDASTGEVVAREQMGKGYEFSKGQYVVLSDEEYKALQAIASNTIELVEFVPAGAIAPTQFDKSYYLGTDKGGDRAYHLLRLAMQDTGLVGVARYSARGKQKLVMLRPHEQALVMQQLHYQEEITPLEEIPIADAPVPAEEELALAEQILEQRKKSSFDPGQYVDEVKQKMLAYIDDKVKGNAITVVPEAAPMGQVIDLMDALKKSLQQDSEGTRQRQPVKKARQRQNRAKRGKTSG